MSIKENFRKNFSRLKDWLAGLSFRTGMIIIGICIVCYILAFVPALFPISLAWKGILWTIFFGLAKTFQYTGILILGKEGVRRLKSYFRRKERLDTE